MKKGQPKVIDDAMREITRVKFRIDFTAQYRSIISEYKKEINLSMKMKPLLLFRKKTKKINH